jgi:hypothetical protein
MKRFLDYINIPKNIKRYFIIKKVDNHAKNSRHSIGIIIVDLLIFVALAATFYYIYFINKRDDLKIFGIVSAVLFTVFFIVKITAFVLKYEKKYEGIEKLILIDDEEGVNIKSWDIAGKTSLLIGKSSKDGEVDIDLSDTEYSSLISRQHAVLNFANGSWYIEDIGSANGSGIKRTDENSKFKIEKGKPYKLNSGDIIYIANTKLLTK